jgi:hypothetical protein
MHVGRLEQGLHHFGRLFPGGPTLCVLDGDDEVAQIGVGSGQERGDDLLGAPQGRQSMARFG